MHKSVLNIGIFNPLFLLLFIAPFCGTTQPKVPNSKIKNFHLDKAWFANDSLALTKDLHQMFDFYRIHYSNKVEQDEVKAMIVPHASIFYSGICAMSSYGALLEKQQNYWAKNEFIKHVIIIAPSHHKNYNGIICPEFEEYITPLGHVKVNTKNVAKISTEINRKPQNSFFDVEHSIEMQLPFLQYSIKEFDITPVLVGNIDASNHESIAQIINSCITENTLVIVSTDFTHFGDKFNFKPYSTNITNQIRAYDNDALQPIFELDYNKFDIYLAQSKLTVCGRNAIKLFLSLKNESIETSIPMLTNYYSSAHILNGYRDKLIEIEDLFGYISDHKIESSVSYVSMLFLDKELTNNDMLSTYDKRALAIMSNEILINQFIKPKEIRDEDFYAINSPGMKNKHGVFITLNKNEALRGCMGQIFNSKNLIPTIHHMTIASAFMDDRFDSLKLDEIGELSVSLSLLTKPVEISSISEIKMGEQGVILSKKVKGKVLSAVYLPEVATQMGWSLTQMLNSLSKKAGLKEDAWKNNSTFEVFKSIKFNFENY